MPRLILIVLFLLYGAFANACDCFSYSNTFCESIVSPSGEIRVSVLLIGKPSMDGVGRMSIKVQNIITGEVDKDNISIFLTSCSPHVPIGDNDEFLFALHAIDQDDYTFVACGISFLKVSGNEVVGPIAPGVNRVKIDELSELASCGDVFKSFSDQIEIYPNPTFGIIKIKNTSNETTFEDLKIHVYDSSGKLVLWRKSNNAILPDENWELLIEDLANGVYMVQIFNQFQVTTKKVVKIRL